MYRRQSTTICPLEPFLEKRGLRGRKMVALEAGLFHAQEAYKWLINVNAVTISCMTEITPNNVRVALRKLCQRHPNLRMKVVTCDCESIGDRYIVFFETDPEPDLEVLDTEDWVATCEAEFEKSFQEDGLQWRVKMLKGSRDPDNQRLRYRFVFTYNHAVTDGGSIMAGIHKNFHHYLEDAVCGKDSVVKSLDLLPGRETLFPNMEPSIFDRMMYKVKELFKVPLLTDDPMAIELLKAIQPENDSQVRCTKFIPMDFTVEETGKIVKKCREHGIKVNGYATAAAAIATGNLLRKYTKNPELKKELTFDLSFMFNIRRIYYPPILPEQVGLLNSIMPMPITVADDGTNCDAFWELAKKCHQDVHAKIEGNMPAESAKLFNYLLGNNPDVIIKSFAEATNPHSIYYMTNRGSFEINSQYPDEKGACTFEGNYWACSEHEMNFDVFAQCLQSVNGRMTWILTYYGHKCSEKIAKEYLDNIREIMLRMLD
jgi:hypothetical protein